MKETKFINQKKEKWKELEDILDSPNKDPDKLNELFIQVTDDLSYSKTFYPNRSVRVYLNGLAQKIFFSIYKNKKKFKPGRLITFWTAELPRLVYESRKAFLYSFLIFLLSFLIGMLSGSMDSEFLEVILGEQYVEMTKANIASGDPMAVYKEAGPLSMSVGITLNNLQVALLTFITGIFFAIGSVIVLVRNGIMIGAFQYFFIEHGVFRESFLTIWIHGTLEISAIIIAGAAGITMGAGLVFPGTHRRLQAFQKSARRGLKIMIGIVPIIILAGFIEGFLTRFTETPDIIRALFIFLCLAFVLFYFVWYPFTLARKGFPKKHKEERLPPDGQQGLNFDRIKDTGEIFSDVFFVSRKYLGKIILSCTLTALFFSLATFLFKKESPLDPFMAQEDLFSDLFNLDQFISGSQLAIAPLLNIFIISLLAMITFSILHKNNPSIAPSNTESRVITFLKMLIPAGVLVLLLQAGSTLSFLFFVLLGPILLLWMYCIYIIKGHVLEALSHSFNVMSYGKLLGAYVLLTLTSFLFLGLMNTGLVWLLLSVLEWVIHFEQETLNEISDMVLNFITVFALHLILPILMIGVGLSYYSLKEISRAAGLKEKISSIGTGERIRGLERE